MVQIKKNEMNEMGMHRWFLSSLNCPPETPNQINLKPCCYTSDLNHIDKTRDVSLSDH